MVEEEEIVIVGGGVAGIATALALSRVGLSSRVLERSHELRASGAALSLYPNAWLALRALGIDHKLTAVYDRWNKLHVTSLDTGANQESDISKSKFREKAVFRTVHRKALLEALAEELPPNTIRFSSKLISIKSATQDDSSKATNLLYLEDGTVVKAKVVIGCDGVHSAVAQWLGLSEPKKVGQLAIRAISVFPDGHGLQWHMRQYMNRGVRVGFVPLSSTEVYWYISWKSTSSDMDMPTSPDLILKEAITNLAKDFPLDFLTVAENTDLSTLSWAPLICRAPWSIAFGPTRRATVTVAGDAMHPMTPDMGQGGCTALEDAVILARCLSQARGVKHWPEAALQRYVAERRWRVSWIVACAWYTGRIQHSGGTGEEWWSGPVRLFRDIVFNKVIFPCMVASVWLWYDCGDLSSAK